MKSSFTLSWNQDTHHWTELEEKLDDHQHYIVVVVARFYVYKH